MAVQQAAEVSPDRSSVVRIGLWGGPLAGKTTYLAALSLAILFHESSGWTIDGLDEFPGSAKFLADHTERLLGKRFPVKTEARADYGFTISGSVTPALLARLNTIVDLEDHVERIADRLGRRVEFTLQVRDYPGDAYANTLNANDDLWDYLSKCDGIVYLFDPEREIEQWHDRNFMYLHRSITLLRSRVRGAGKLRGNKLPHFLAVCITKFDEPAIYNRLDAEHLVEKPARGVPYVQQARRAFQLLAEEQTVNLMRNHFDRRRIAYFATSSVGLYVDEKTNQVNPADPGNTFDDLEEGRCIRGRVRPINVLEPLLWIHDQVMKGRPSARPKV